MSTQLTDFSVKRSVGVRIPPNLSKILYEWGLRDALSKASRCRKTGFHSSKALIRRSFLHGISTTSAPILCGPELWQIRTFLPFSENGCHNLHFGSNDHVSTSINFGQMVA